MITPEQHISEIRNVTLTEAERVALRNKLRAYALSYVPVRSVPVRAWGWMSRHGVLALGIAVAVIAGATGVSASRAEPGDALYGFRLSVNDRIETALVFDDEAQINLEMQQMQRMIDAEDALRDEELSDLAFTDDVTEQRSGEKSEQESEQQGASFDDDSDAADDGVLEDDQEQPEAFDDGSFERELRSLESELQAEDGAGLELE